MVLFYNFENRNLKRLLDALKVLSKIKFEVTKRMIKRFATRALIIIAQFPVAHYFFFKRFPPLRKKEVEGSEALPKAGVSNSKPCTGHIEKENVAAGCSLK